MHTLFHRTPAIFLLVLATGILSVSHVSRAQTHSTNFSQRIGNVIDRNARAYFGLFPAIQSFDTATVHIGVDTAFFSIARIGSPDTLLTLPLPVAHELAVLIDEMESVYRGEQRVNWTLLRDIVTPHQLFDRGNEFEVIDRSGTKHRGVLLYADENQLVIDPEFSSYQWRRSTTQHSFHATDVRSVRKGSATIPGLVGGLALGAVTGYVVKDAVHKLENECCGLISSTAAFGSMVVVTYLGAFIGSTLDVDMMFSDEDEYRAALPRLRTFAYFFSIPPPEIARLQPDPAATADVSVSSQSQAAGGTDYFATLAIGGGRTTGGSTDINTVGRFSNLTIDNGGLTYLLAGGYRITSRFSIALTVAGSQSLRSDDNVETLSYLSFMATPELSIAAPQLGGSINLIAGSGIGVAIVTASNTLTSPFSGSSLRSDTSVTVTTPIIAPYFGVSYQILPGLTARFITEERILLSATIPEYVLSSSVGPIRRVPEHTVRVLSTGVSLGLSITL